MHSYFVMPRSDIQRSVNPPGIIYLSKKQPEQDT